MELASATGSLPSAMAGLMSQGNVIRAFSAHHVERLTGLSKSQLNYWDETDFFKPRLAFENRKSPFSRVYSFRDVVGLKTIALLRKRHGVSLQHLRQVADKLSHLEQDLWSSLTLFVFNKEVAFDEPETGRRRGVVSGQYISIPLAGIIGELTEDANKLKERARSQFGKIERHRFVVHNAWVVAGTRIPTKAIQRFHEAGYSFAGIIREYPILKKSDIEAALLHEADLAEAM